MATVDDIGWGEYLNYCGPFYRGQHAFKLSDEPTKEEMIMAVITATEGGCADAINMYDGDPILSSGYIQFIEGKGQRSVSAMLGSAMERGVIARDRENRTVQRFFDVLKGLQLRFERANNRSGKWYFFDPKDGRVDTTEEQNSIFRKGSTGEKGTWSPVAMERGKRWAAAVATFWESPFMQQQQVQYTVPMLRRFAFGKSKAWVFSAPHTSIGQAFVAAYLSFAVNNPTRASKHLGIAVDSVRHAPWTKDWLIGVLNELTFGPGIGIYPHRYNAIRPELERLYNIDLPDFADELRKWARGRPKFGFDVLEIQDALLALGYDLGPHGADNVYGAKTRAAVFAFEQSTGMKDPDGYVGADTAALLEAELERRGQVSLDAR